MGNNFSYTILEEQIINLYDAQLLSLPVLDILCNAYRGTDIDSGGSQDLKSEDGKFMPDICVLLVKPEFKPLLPDEGEEFDEDEHWDYHDEFMEMKGNRWGWR